MTDKFPEMCSCLGKDTACPKCDGTGVIDKSHSRMQTQQHLANLWDPIDAPYVRHHPSDNCTCKLCGTKVKRRKIWQHIQEEHPDQKTYEIPEDIEKKLQQ
jgi:hypothetical protein